MADDAHDDDARPNAASRLVECVIPILRVQSLRASIAFYVERLGFAVDWGGEADATMASVSRDGRAIMLCQGAQGQPGTWVWVGVNDTDLLYEQLTERGVVVRQKPTNYPWAYEMRIEDPDGHVLRIGSECRPDLPFA